MNIVNVYLNSTNDKPIVMKDYQAEMFLDKFKTGKGDYIHIWDESKKYQLVFKRSDIIFVNILPGEGMK